MQSAFITLIECLWIFIMSQRITMNAQRIDSSGNSECNFVVQVCVRLQSEIYDACRHIMSFMCAKEWMNRWDIKDQGQCETNNIFRYFLNVPCRRFSSNPFPVFIRTRKLLKICNNCKIILKNIFNFFLHSASSFDEQTCVKLTKIKRKHIKREKAF